MLNIERETLEKLNFNLETALAEFAEAKRQHAFTIDVPAPTAHPLVEAAFAAGGFQILEPPPQPELPPPSPPENMLAKSDALERLKRIQGKTVGTQLDEMRTLLIQFFESMPG
jgi:hypothetical protein